MLKPVICLGISLVLSACGFKSDLFLPGEPTKVEQLDVSAIQTIKDETVSILKENGLEADTDTQVAPSGVAVEIPTLTPSEENNSEKKDKNK